MNIRNTFIIFIVSGFWHGANWTFIVWGALNAIYFLPLLLMNQNRQHLETVAIGKLYPNIKELASILLTFGLTVFAWIFFRAENISHAMNYISEIFSSSLFDMPRFDEMKKALLILFLVGIFMLIEWCNREHQFALENIKKLKRKWLRWLIYLLILSTIYFYGNLAEAVELIYFQF